MYLPIKALPQHYCKRLGLEFEQEGQEVFTNGRVYQSEGIIGRSHH